MQPLSDCPPPSILQAVATGCVQEPLLSLYLEHVAGCDTCCRRIEQATPTARASVAAHGPADLPEPPVAGQDERAWLDRWLTRLEGTASRGDPADGSGIPANVGPFRVNGILGTGASSVVYEAVDEELGRTVVLKVLRTVHGADPEQHRLIVSEARALAAVQHDNVMPLLQLTWHEGTPVLVFPRLAGETLAAALAAKRCTPRLALTVVRDVARALAHTHAIGIFHHDIKPSNIWLRRPEADGDATALLFDFGLSGSTDAAVGTPGYSEPQPAATADPESRDLFSLGVVLHECLAAAGRAPQGGRDLVRRLTGDASHGRPRAADVVVEIDRLLARPRQVRRTIAASVGVVAILAFAGVSWAIAGRTAGKATVALPIKAGSGPIQPESIIPGNGLPVAFSGAGQLQCVASDGRALSIRDAAGGKTLCTIPLDFAPQRLVFNAEANRVAAADDAGHVAIVDVPSATVSGTHQFPDGVEWMGWSGWKRDVLVILSDRDVHALFKTRPAAARRGGAAPPVPDATPEVPAEPAWKHSSMRGDVHAVATLPGKEAVLSLGTSGTLTIWSVGNLVEDMTVRLPPVDLSQPAAQAHIGWKSPGVCFIATGRRIMEHAPLHAPESYTVAHPIRSIVWPTASEYVLLTADADGKSRLICGDRLRPEWSRDCDLGGEQVVEIMLLDDRRHVLAITTAGAGRIYPIRP